MSRVQVIICLLTLVGIFNVSGLAAAQNFREIARRLGPPEDGKPIGIPSSPGEYWPRTIEEVARDAVVVLRATVSRNNSYLAASEDRILTDYAILAPQIIAGHLVALPAQTPGTPVPLTLTVWGGEAVVDGVPMRSENVDIERIKDGGQYVLFLRPGRGPRPGRYEIYYGAIFEVSQDTVRPLLRNANDVFKRTADAHLNDLVARIEKAVQVR